ncbi:LAFA_0G12376g1_1 [Lachancea sp. 'fantastica']|nr:LAFA_0G12376g1_1 [Lachancea sp. 'fantastica']
MFRPGFVTLRRGFPSKVLLNSSRHFFTVNNGAKISSRTHVKTAAKALTAGALLGFLISGSLIGLEEPKKNVESGKIGSSSAPEVKSAQDAVESKTSAPETKEAKENKTDSDDKTKPQSAYDPETGVINWDCPCLGGMAQGPCGEEFKAAFSCFVYSEEDPKGVDCIEKFKGMQECFRKYPDYYAEQIKDEEDAAHAAQKLESRNDQDEMVEDAHNVHPEESAPVLQQQSEFEPALSAETPQQEAEPEAKK